MLFRSFKRVNPLLGFNRNLFTFTESYQKRKDKIYDLKMRENVKIDPSDLISEQILIDSLVPNFFLNELTL